MLWVLSLHIMTMVVWTAATLYVAIVLHTDAGKPISKEGALSVGEQANFIGRAPGIDSIARFVYTHVATPAALISIAAGSVVFLLNESRDFWLIAKLTLVTLLCVAQACMGLLIIKAERGEHKNIRLWCKFLLILFCVLMTVIVWIVLAKPAEPAWVDGLW